MKQHGNGHCISIASGISVRGIVNEVSYCAAKLALEGFTIELIQPYESSWRYPGHLAPNISLVSHCTSQTLRSRG